MSDTIREAAILPEAEARRLYSEGDAAHDFDHVLRVTRWAEHIAAAEGADVTVVRLAALLHDVPLPSHDDAHTRRKAHHLAAADYARELLTTKTVDSHNLGELLGTERIANIVHAIEAHRFRDQSIQPQTLEAKCLYDADKLGSMGAIGIARAFAFGGAHQSRPWTEAWTEAPPESRQPQGADYTPVHEFVYKLQRLLATLHTDTARRIGAERHRFMREFFDQLDAEMHGLV